MLGGQAFAGAAQQDFSGQFGGAELAGTGGVAQVVEQLAQGGKDRVAAMAVDQREAGRVAQKGVDGGQAWGVAG